MNCCCNKHCRQGRDCPVRIKRIREAKERLDREERRDLKPSINSLVLAVTIMLAIWAGSMIHESARLGL
jgi:hypothetical protein